VRRVVILVSAGLLAGVVLLAVRRVKDADGPELNEAIRDHEGDLPERSMTVRAILSVVIVAMGASIGREAALKQMGGVVGKRFAELLRMSPAQRKLLAACGVGAGMAAAYNVPFGGALFTLEVLLETVSPAVVLAAFVTSFVATWISWLMLPNLATYQIPDLHATPALMIWAILAGPILGFASILFARGIHWSKEHSPQRLPHEWWIVAAPVVAFAALGFASIPFPQLLGNGRGVVQLAFDLKIPITLLMWLVLLRPLATMLVLRAGCPGGLFTPTMTFGALAGAALGVPWNRMVSAAAATDARCYALLGTGAVLAAATQAPLSSVAFTLELTAHADRLMMPLLIVVCGAALTFRQFESRSTS
jgi:CIC family chloride channel protein